MKKAINSHFCNVCLMDHTAANFQAYEDIGCNYCLPVLMNKSGSSKHEDLEKILNNLHETPGEYKAVVGVSGGVDSSYVAHLLDQSGIKVLLVHMDNGWDSHLATSNIKKIVNGTRHDFVSYVLYWPELRDMQKSFMLADVVDIELLYDHAAAAILYYYAKKFKIKTIIDGVNQQTEGIKIPDNWRWYKYDGVNIRDISRRVTHVNYPYFGTIDRIKAKIKGIKRISLLNHISFQKNDALKKLEDRYKYQRYAGKHEESTFTKFYQDIILPNKFGVDKRKLHLSDLILNREIDRDQAVNAIKSVKTLEYFLDTDCFILNKLNLSKNEFRNYITRPIKKHSDFRNEYATVNFVKKIVRR